MGLRLAKARSLLPVTLASLLVLGVLISLGFWQIRRMEWKQQLLEHIELQLSMTPTDLTTMPSPQLQDLADFFPVTGRGKFVAEERHIYSLHEGQPGWRVVSPLLLAGSTALMVDRGFVPEAAKNTKRDLPSGEVIIQGVIRSHDEGQGLFTPENRPDVDSWYWWDKSGLGKSFASQAGLTVEPVVVQLTEPVGLGEGPIVTATRPELQNRHLGYAITWFGLAACLCAVYAAYLRSRLRAVASTPAS